MPPLNPYISVQIASIIAFLFCAFCAPGAGASTGEIQNHDFKFVSCEITEDSFWVANLLGARYGKEYTMILNENAYNSMCPKFKKGDYVNITYKQDRVADEGDGGEFEAYVLVSYRMISPQQSASNRGADKKDDSSSLANKIVPYVLLGIIILWIIGFIRKLVAVPHLRLYLIGLINEAGGTQAYHEGDWSYNSLVERVLTEYMYGIKTKSEYKTFLKAIETSESGLFTVESFKQEFIKKIKIFKKHAKLKW